MGHPGLCPPPASGVCSHGACPRRVSPGVATAVAALQCQPPLALPAWPGSRGSHSSLWSFCSIPGPGTGRARPSSRGLCFRGLTPACPGEATVLQGLPYPSLPTSGTVVLSLVVPSTPHSHSACGPECSSPGRELPEGKDKATFCLCTLLGYTDPADAHSGPVSSTQASCSPPLTPTWFLAGAPAPLSGSPPALPCSQAVSSTRLSLFMPSLLGKFLFCLKLTSSHGMPSISCTQLPAPLSPSWNSLGSPPGFLSPVARTQLQKRGQPGLPKGRLQGVPPRCLQNQCDLVPRAGGQPWVPPVCLSHKALPAFLVCAQMSLYPPAHLLAYVTYLCKFCPVLPTGS